MIKRKILFMMPSLVGGGAERTLVNLLQKIDYEKYEVDLLVVLKQGVYLNQIPKEVNLLFLFNNSFFVRSLAYLQKNAGLFFPFKKRMDKVIVKNYDVGISFLDSNFTDLLFLTDKIEKKYTWVHSSYVSNPNYSNSYKRKDYRKKLIKNRYAKLDGIYFVSKNAKEEFIEVFGKYPNMDVVYNLIDNENVIIKSQKNLDFPKTKFRFVAIGSLYKVKGYDKLMKATKIIKENGYDFEVIIAGKGPEENYLKNLVKENGLDTVVKFAGFLDNPYPLLKNCDVFMMTSVSEGLPTVLAEAMILGKPVLVTNCSGCREVVNNGEFGLMANQRAESIAENMLSCLTSPELLKDLKNKSTKRSKIFNEKMILSKYYSVFNS